MARDPSADVFGLHPFRVSVTFGDFHAPAYAADDQGRVSGPGVQVLTPTAERKLYGESHVTPADLDRVAGRLGTDFPFLLNVACQANPARFAERMHGLAAAAGTAIDAEDNAVLDALKSSVDHAQALGPRAIVAAAMAYLAAPLTPGGPAYGRLIEHVNRVLTNPGNNPRRGTPASAIAGVGDIAAEGIHLWWVKEGSATIVFQVRVPLAGPGPAVSFVINVAKDLTGAADELRRNHANFVEFHRIDPLSVMEPFGFGHAPVNTWRGPVEAAVLAGEWFDGHELHVYENGPRLHVWLDQHMGREHPLPDEGSDRVWEQMTRLRAHLTRVSPAGLQPIATHVNAGDYIFRQKADGTWDVLLIWMREPPAGLSPEDYVVVAAMLGGVNVFGSRVGKTVWWDQPELALDALCAGLQAAGLHSTHVHRLLERAHDGPFSAYAAHPEHLPYALAGTADPLELRAVFDRARATLAKRVRTG